MNYGSGRLVDVREGPNVRLSFDGVKVKSTIGPWQIDGFVLRPTQDEPGFFDNSPNKSVGFWGIYGVRRLTRNVTLDTYYLGIDREAAQFNRGRGQERRHSVGARLSHPVAQAKPYASPIPSPPPFATTICAGDDPFSVTEAHGKQSGG